METIPRLIAVVSAVIVIIYWRYSPIDIPKDAADIVKYAKMPTFPLGRMDGRTMESVYRWTFGIIVTAYRVNKHENAIDLVFRWMHEQNDITGCVKLGCEHAIQRVSNVLERKLEDPEHVDLTCNPDFDYHILPSTLRFNDYVDCQDLISKIDNLLEV